MCAVKANLRQNIEQGIVVDRLCWFLDGVFLYFSFKVEQNLVQFRWLGGVFVVKFSGECFEIPQLGDSCNVVMGECVAIWKMSGSILPKIC